MCKPEMMPFYESCGFVYEPSIHRGKDPKKAAKNTNNAAEATETVQSGSACSEESGGGGVDAEIYVELHARVHAGVHAGVRVGVHAGDTVSGGGSEGGKTHAGVHCDQAVSGCGAASVAARQLWMGSVPPEYTTEFIKRAFAGGGGGKPNSIGDLSLDSDHQVSTIQRIVSGGGSTGGQPLAVVVRRNAFRQGGVSVVGSPRYRLQSSDDSRDQGTGTLNLNLEPYTINP
jgi:hypothetical protein